MNPDDFGLEATFEIDENLDRRDVARIGGEVMASIGFFFRPRTLQENAFSGNPLTDPYELMVSNLFRAMAAQSLPVTLFGDAYRMTQTWQDFRNAEPQGSEKWNSPRRFGVSYFCDLEEFGAFQNHRFDGTSICDIINARGFALNNLQMWRLIREGGSQRSHRDKLVFRSGVNPNLFLGGECSGLDRFWFLAFQDAIVQLHRRLGSKETIIWQQTYEDSVRIHALEYPGKLYFSEFDRDDLYRGVAFGVPEIDEALDAYEADLCNDRLRQRAIAQFVETTKPDKD